MKRLILILLVLSSCVDQEIRPSQSSYTDEKSSENKASRALVGCDYAYQFGIPESTMTMITPNLAYKFNIKTKVVAMTDGAPLWSLGSMTSRNTTLTYKVWNTGGSTIKYKIGGGSWVTMLPGATTTFTRPAYLRSTSCTSNITVFDFTIDAVRVNCGTMPPTGNHFNCVIQLLSATNGYTIASNSFIGFNTSHQDCPI